MSVMETFVKEKVIPKPAIIKEVELEVRTTHPTQLDHGNYLYHPEMLRLPDSAAKTRPNNQALAGAYMGEKTFKGNQPGPLATDVGFSKPGDRQRPVTNKNLYNPLKEDGQAQTTLRKDHTTRSRSKLDSLIGHVSGATTQESMPPNIKYRRPPIGQPDLLQHPEKVYF